ncbi:MAG TPA: hypothetical protein VIJ46_02500 [Rhabdochlamydiaceae bacterium]
MSLSPVTTRAEVSAAAPSTSPLMGSPRREGIAATASSLSSMATSAVENISSDVAQQRLIDNACKAVKHVMYVHPCGGDRAMGGNPVVSVKALLVFKLDGSVVATSAGFLETIKGEEIYSQKVLDKHNWDRQEWSILKANPGITTDAFHALITKGDTASWPAYESAEPAANKAFRESAERVVASLKLDGATKDSQLTLTLITLDEKVNTNRPGKWQVVVDSKVHVTPNDSGKDYKPGVAESWMDGPRNIDLFVDFALKGCGTEELQGAKRFFAEPIASK